MDLHSIEICAGVGMLGEGVRAAFGLLGIKHRTVCYVEREAPAAAQIARLMEAGALDSAPIWSDLLTFDGTAWRGCVDFIIAGFPCQDISIAGQRAGLDGKRSGLFFDILDIADACQARGLVLENVAAIATATASAVDEAEGTLEERAAARVVGELADRGWDAEWLTLSAYDVGASHGRARWFCLAWRVADTGHGPRARQPLGVSGGSGPTDDCTGCQALGDAERARWEAPRRRPEINAGGQLEPGRDAVDDPQCVEFAGQRIHARPGTAGHGAPDADGTSSPLDDPECAGLATVDDHGQCLWIVADADGTGCGTERIAERQDADSQSRQPTMVHTCEQRLPHAQQHELGGSWPGHEGRAASQFRGAPLFAPGPLDPGWAAIVANRPDLAPAVEPGVRMLADGMAYLVDESRAHQLRQVGNGVVSLQAAVALVYLVRRARKK